MAAAAPVRLAIVENWRTDPRLTELWLEQMQSFTDAAISQISADPRALATLAGQDIQAVASALTWLGERLYYLAAIGTPPFADQDTLVNTLVSIWAAVLNRQCGWRPGFANRYGVRPSSSATISSHSSRHSTQMVGDPEGSSDGTVSRAARAVTRPRGLPQKLHGAWASWAGTARS